MSFQTTSLRKWIDSPYVLIVGSSLGFAAMCYNCNNALWGVPIQAINGPGSNHTYWFSILGHPVVDFTSWTHSVIHIWLWNTLTCLPFPWILSSISRLPLYVSAHLGLILITDPERIKLSDGPRLFDRPNHFHCTFSEQVWGRWAEIFHFFAGVLFPRSLLCFRVQF